MAAVEKQRRVRLTHRFLSAPRVRTLNCPATGIGAVAPHLPPALVLVDREGREAWRFLESDHRKRPGDAELARAVTAAEAQTR